jgi:xylose isomerase
MTDFFKGIDQIKYEGPRSKNALAFKHYDADLKVLGTSMRDHLRFSVAYWHTFRGTGGDPFGPGTMKRAWETEGDPLEIAIQRVRAAFEFMRKLGVPYYCFHDRDVAPEGKTLAETNRNLDAVVKVMKQLQTETGIKLLWGTANLFSNPRFMNGAATNPDAHVFAYAAAQVKKAMEVTVELGGENYVFWGGREGYQTLLNTDMKRELDHMARFLGMAAEYKRQIGFTGTLLVEPKPKEPTAHQYDFDAAAVIGFLRGYGLDKEFKLNLECNHATLAGHSFLHEIELASRYGLLGSVDANRGDLLLGWDTDQFPMDSREAALILNVILRQNGLGSGGFNFDAKLRRESTDLEDMFIGHIGGMDTLARGLVAAARMREDGVLEGMVRDRYHSYDGGIGARIEGGTTSFKELEKWALEAGEPQQRSAKQEQFEMLLNSYT